jgi:hypothetical protein
LNEIRKEVADKKFLQLFLSLKKFLIAENGQTFTDLCGLLQTFTDFCGLTLAVESSAMN